MSEGIPPIDQALMPAAVRNGDGKRKQEYQAALQFERVLVGQMTQAMTAGMSLGGDDEDGGNAATQQLKQQLPDTLADALMSSGGIGLAGQLDQMWHPNATSTSLSKTQSEAAQSGGGATTGTTTSADASNGGAAA